MTIKRLGIGMVGVVAFTMLAGLLYGGTAHAYSGTGYYTDKKTCNFTGSSTLCNATWMPYSNDVVPGRPAVTNSVPNYATKNKDAFYSWLMQLDNDSHERMARRFIIDTMNGGDGTGSAGLKRKLDDPKLGMSKVYKTPPGDISFYGLNSSGDHDMFFTGSYNPSARWMLRFYNKDTGKTYYYLEIPCGNPVGGLPGLPKYWRIEGTTSMWIDGAAASGTSSNPAKVQPGQTVSWRNVLQNVGPSPDTSTSINYRVYTYYNQVKSSADPVDGNQNGTLAPRLNVGKIFEHSPTAASNQYSSVVIKPEWAGKTICSYIWWDPTSRIDSTSATSTKRCVYVASNYDLYPGVTGGSYTPSPLLPGSSIPLTGVVQNESSRPSDRDSPYEVHQFVVKNSVGSKPDFGAVFTDSQGSYLYTTADHANDQACTSWLSNTFKNKISDCDMKKHGVQKFPGDGPHTVSTGTINADDFNPGDWVCWFVSVGIYKYDVPLGSISHRISHPVCVVIAKQPNVQVWGHDVRAGDGYTTAMLNNEASVLTARMFASSANRSYGSWAEYGIFAPSNGVIESASGGALSGKDGRAGALAASALTPLTFANTGVSGGGYGKWAPPSMLLSLLDAAKKLPQTDTFKGYNFAINSNFSDVGPNEIKTIPWSGPNPHDYVRIQGGTTNFAKGAGAIILSDTPVRIEGDINIDASSQVINELGGASQLVIIAPKIIIANNVRNIDAWLVAVPTAVNSDDGIISTCDEIKVPYYEGLRLGDDCSKTPLRINGALFAREVQFRRTYGADKGMLATPAEVVNLRADAFMWGRVKNATVSASGTPIDTVFTTELPPRF